MSAKNAKSQFLQFRLTVRNIEPEIWRKVLVSSEVTLARLHQIVQVLMGWNDRHLYAFVINAKRYCSPFDDDDQKKNELFRTKLSKVFSKDAPVITYEYDFRDRWEIELRNEARERDPEEQHWAECLEGSRHGPVEGSGGSRDYMEKARIYNNPQHKRFLEVRRWIGPKFDPEAFDVGKTNEKLRRIS
jgi:hypothetical protein